MSDDQEIVAMTAIARALEVLDEGARARTLGWAAARFAVPLVTTHPGSEKKAAGEGAQDFTDFAELFEAAGPKTEKDKALVAAYWAQVCRNQPNFASQALNDALKDLGHGIGNITRALEELKGEKPALILQLQKSGSAKQARKVYRVTQEGVKRVLEMINGGAGE